MNESEDDSLTSAEVPGTFIVFEGGEGSGKSTQAKRLAQRLGNDVVLTREPGGTPVGAKIREILLHPDTDAVSPRAEALLMAADRAHHVATHIRPALAAGRTVISDRFMASSMAYQGAGRGLGMDVVRDLSLFAVDGVLPDLVLLIDVPVAVGRARAGERGAPDKMEQEGVEFHERIRQAFLAIADGHPQRWLIIDGTGTEEEVAASVDAAVAERFGR